MAKQQSNPGKTFPSFRRLGQLFWLAVLLTACYASLYLLFWADSVRSKAEPGAPEVTLQRCVAAQAAPNMVSTTCVTEKMTREEFAQKNGGGNG